MRVTISGRHGSSFLLQDIVNHCEPFWRCNILKVVILIDDILLIDESDDEINYVDTCFGNPRSTKCVIFFNFYLF